MRTLLFVTTCLASPALAQCPTGADLERGVTLTDTSGTTETYWRVSEHIIRGTWRDSGGYGANFRILKGLYVVEAYDTEDGEALLGTRSTHFYSVKPDNIPIPTDGGRWDTHAITWDQDGVRTAPESYVFGPTVETTLGGCRYDMIPIIVMYPDLDGYEETLNYLPALGFSYLAEMRPANEPSERYTYVSFEAEK